MCGLCLDFRISLDSITNDLPDASNYNDLDFLKILGGEPFLDNKNIELIKQVPRKNIKLMLVTNNSIFLNNQCLICYLNSNI